MGGIPAVAATLYQGAYALVDDRHVRMASIEPRLEQLGQEGPTIRVALRPWEGQDQHYDEVLRLSLDDAPEFMAALGYLVETAEA
jgi:hypothetical protein